MLVVVVGGVVAIAVVASVAVVTTAAVAGALAVVVVCEALIHPLQKSLSLLDFSFGVSVKKGVQA